MPQQCCVAALFQPCVPRKVRIEELSGGHELVAVCAASNSAGPVLLSQVGLQVLPRMLHLKGAELLVL